jgi:hypothetical protein
MQLHHLIFLSFVILTGCSGSSSTVGSGGSSDGATLFDTPDEGSNVTPGSMYGVWGGSLEENGITFDTRWHLSANSITLANRCKLRDGRESETVGVTARARVTDDEITFLESKKDEKRTGDFWCRVSATPRTLSACGGVHEGFEQDCFRLSGTTLTLYGNPLEKLELVKLSD